MPILDIVEGPDPLDCACCGKLVYWLDSLECEQCGGSMHPECAVDERWCVECAKKYMHE